MWTAASSSCADILAGTLLAVEGWLAAIGLVDWAKGSAHVYPVANVAHVLGAIMLVGGIGIIDLRVIGLWRRLPLVALSAALTPVAVAGLALQAGSGLVLFAADGEALARSWVFHAKLVLLALALANAAAFRLYWRRAARRGGGDAPRLPARLLAFASLAVWITIVAGGRLIAYY